MRVILASASPRRRELLSLLLEEFDCCSADIDETPISDELPEDYVLRMAVEKASAVKNERGVIIGSDTVVVLSGNILQKPASVEDARGMLSALSGQTHQVMTAVAIMIDAELMTIISTTEVTFSTLEMPLIEAYLATDEPWDKAGAYGIQGIAGSFVRRIDGSYSSVVGLPLCETRELLEGAGIRTRMAGTHA
jgi:septum formation protein